jgi:HSP20 family protein
MMRNFDDMSQMFEQMDRMIDQMRSGTMGGMDSMTNLVEEDDEYVFVMDLPGFETEEIDLVYHDGHLKISAVTEIDEESEHASLRHSRSVTETVSIPGEIEVEDIEASYHNGVLEVHLPILEGSIDDGHHIDVR